MIRKMIKYKEIEGIKEIATCTSEKHENERRRSGKKGGSGSGSGSSDFLKKVVGLAKDKQSLFCITLSTGKKEYRNQALEIAIVRATSHDETEVDYKNANRVFEWVKTSPTFLRPFFWYLTKRIEKTRSWVVAIKALMLVHGVFCTKASALRNLPRLPFDLSNFHDRYSDPTRAWGFTLLVRSYYAFLDHKSNFMAYENADADVDEDDSSRTSIASLQRLQTLLDLLLQIKLYCDGMEVPLVLDAVDCVLIEIFEVYSGICDGVAAMLCCLFSLNKGEAAMALRVLETVTAQNAMLADYFDGCRRMGVLNAMELPALKQQIPEEDISDIKSIITQILGNGGSGGFVGIDQNPARPQLDNEAGDDGDDDDKRSFFKGSSQTIVTQDWEVFNDEMEVEGGNGGEQGNGCSGGRQKDLVYDFGSCLDVGNGRRSDFNALWLRPPKMERDFICV